MSNENLDQNQKQALHLRLIEEAEQMRAMPLRDLMFAPGRTAFMLSLDELLVDMTRQPMRARTRDLLLDFAKACQLDRFIKAMTGGKIVNMSENRPARHCDLRQPDYLASDAFQRMANFAEPKDKQKDSQKDKQKDRQIRHIINLGIGGSDLGPAMVYQALKAFHLADKQVHFVGNIDPSCLYDVLQTCDPHKTLFIITSKTFTTQETLANAHLARRWLEQHGAAGRASMVAVTASPENAKAWGIDDAQIFSFDEGIGGRYSVWSAVGLSVLCAIGVDNFTAFLKGGHAMDRHFITAAWEENIPVLMGLLRVWHRTYLHRTSYGIMPYDQRLARLPAWVQQLEMESNGKSVDRHGVKLSSPTAPLIWGEAGTNSQHSFFQWLHQGSDIVPIDILLPRHSTITLSDQEGIEWQNNHRLLVINALAQAEALALGKKNTAEPHRHFDGNRPSLLVSWHKTTPYALGQILALYEHITAVSGFLWGVNSFDQWGVELGKEMASMLDSSRESKSEAEYVFSPAAQFFIKRRQAEESK